MMNDLLLVFFLGIIVLMGCFVLILDVFIKVDDSCYLGYFIAVGMLISLSFCYMFWDVEGGGFQTTYFSGMMFMGRFEILSCVLLVLFGFFVSFFCGGTSVRRGL